MNQELQQKLYRQYPGILREMTMHENKSCMAYGLSVGEGWFGIIAQLLFNIYSHRRQLKWNYVYAMRRRQWSTRWEDLKCEARICVHCITTHPENLLHLGWLWRHIKHYVTGHFGRKPTWPSEVVFEQVKEKFGGLRIYARGYDEYVSGLLSMADAMSYITCEDCGKPGKRGGSGWVATLCDECRRRNKI